MADLPPTAGFINSLDPNSPIDSNKVFGGDNWIVFLQDVLQTYQFPISEDGSSNGWDIALTVKASEVNSLLGISNTDTVEDRLTALENTQATGTREDFYQDTAPIGWTIDASVDEHMTRLTKGSVAGGVAGGTTGGTNNFSAQFISINSGSESTHTHTWSATTGGPSSTTTPESGGGDTAASQSHTHTVSGTTSGGASHLHTVDLNAKWAAAIIASKD